MGFEFSVDGRLYNIYVNSDIIIQRKNDYFQFVKLSTGEMSDELKIDDTNFIYMLKLLAISSKSYGGYKGFSWKWFCSYEFIIRIIRSILPINVKLGNNLISQNPYVTITDDSNFFTLDSKSPKFMQSLYNIVEMMLSGKTLFEDLEKEPVEIHIKQCN